jgi:hypothetical protein
LKRDQNLARVSQVLGQRKDWDTNSFQTTPPGGSPDVGVGVSGSSSDKNESYSRSSSDSVTRIEANSDDDSRDLVDRSELLLERATDELVRQGHDRDYVEEAFRFLDQRAFDLGKTASSVNYYLACFETLQHNSAENAETWSRVQRRRELRAKYGIPDDLAKLKLTDEQESARQKFNEQHRLLDVAVDAPGGSSKQNCQRALDDS